MDSTPRTDVSDNNLTFTSEPIREVQVSQSYDNCGYEPDMVMSVDTRNLKWQARQNGVSGAAANKSYNHKDYAKYMKRKGDKEDREA